MGQLSRGEAADEKNHVIYKPTSYNHCSIAWRRRDMHLEFDCKVGFMKEWRKFKKF